MAWLVLAREGCPCLSCAPAPPCENLDFLISTTLSQSLSLIFNADYHDKGLRMGEQWPFASVRGLACLEHPPEV
jgi:hypothetical protein